MERYYTEAVRDGFFDLVEMDTKEIWKDLDRSVEMISSGNWEKHYKKVISKYSLSSRFAFMRILFEKATGLPPKKADENALAKGFSVTGIGDFRNITIKHAKEMTSDEVDRYKQLLLRRVEENNPDFSEEASELVDRVFALAPVGSKSCLSRDEIIRLGHMADFSLEDMQFLLLRVLGDNEVGFHPGSSMDVIDMYGFITHADLAKVDELKNWYFGNVSGIKKVNYADKPAHQTQDIVDSFEYTVSHWTPEEQQDLFKAWLRQQAPYLDVKSKTAQKVYVNLATYAYVRVWEPYLKEISINISDNFYSDMEEIAVGKDYRNYHDDALKLLFENGKPNEEKCEAVAAALIYENAEYADGFRTHNKNAQKFYHVPYVKSNGDITVRGKLNENSKERIKNILMGEISPAKSDLLYLLWFIANDHWIGLNNSVEEKITFMDDFLAASSRLLDAAFLPRFYPPNILEETMMLALVLGDENHAPAMIYESICSTFTDTGVVKKAKGKKNKTPEEKREIVKYYYSHLKEYPTREACKIATAEYYGVGKSSVELWEKEYREGKL